MSKKIYVGNLPFSASTNDLGELFSSHGNVVSVRIIVDRDTGRSKGFAFVEMEIDEEADQAIQQLQGVTYDERRLNITEARPPEARQERSNNHGYNQRTNTYRHR